MPEIKEKHIEKFTSLCEQMQKLLDEIKEYCPGVNIYVEGGGNWNLMKGPTHDDARNQDPLHENVVVMEPVWPSNGGGW